MIMAEHFDDAVDIIEAAIELLQQLRYGNKDQARLKAVEIASAATNLYTKLQQERPMVGILVDEDHDGGE